MSFRNNIEKDDETMSLKFLSNFFLHFTLTILLGNHYNEKYSIKRNQNKKVFSNKKKYSLHVQKKVGHIDLKNRFG